MAAKVLFEFDELVNILLRDNIGKVLHEIYGLYFQHELKGTSSPDLAKES